jgi:hypothetical protein
MTTDSWLGGAAAVATLTFDVDAETPVLAAGTPSSPSMSRIRGTPTSGP